MISRDNNKRRLVALAAGFGLVASALPATMASASNDATAKISSAVTQELKRDGNADVWFYFGDKADLSAANGMSWTERGRFVYEALNSTADASQAKVRALLDEAGADYESFYLVNAIKVSAADAGLVRSVAALASVESVDADVPTEADRPVKTEPITNATTENWGVPNINAPQAWERGATGAGITVGIIDSGVEGTHEALADSWRGAGGSADYNWISFDEDAPATPVDEVGHGTHVAGTVLGSSNETVANMGVAQDAQWIAAAPGMIDDRAISDEGLLSAMEWMLAPTDLNGQNPNPDMRPHVINNSWGAPNSVEAFGEDSQAAWTAAGIFSTFSIGNTGDEGCGTGGSPGSRTINYAVGSYDSDNVISYFSSRGPGQDGVTKPDISAPGEEIPSAVPGNGYAVMSGTSMAAPHLSGAVAVLWSGAPALVGDVQATRALLGQTAIDTADEQCGGTEDFNNVYGEGRLDLLAALEAAPEEEPEPPAVEVTRHAGEQRYETAKIIAEQYADASTVYVTTGEAPYDTLAGSPAAARGVIGTMATPEGEPAPILLVKKDSIPKDDTLAALEAIAPENIVILGSENAVSAAVATELENYAGTVRRIGGADRYETAVNLAREFTNPSTIYVALGTDGYFADALSGSALAGTEGAPILLVKTDSTPGVVSEYLAEHEGANVIILGGENVVNQDVYEEVGASGRFGAADRFLTSLEISKQFESAEHVFIATGRNYPDALAGGAYAGSVNAPVILVHGDRDELPNGETSQQFADQLQAELDRLNPSTVVILGGPAAVSQGIEDQITEMVNN